MADKEIVSDEMKLEEMARAINLQATLLAEIVKAADHIVKAYIEVTKIQEAQVSEKETEVKE